MVIIHLVYMVKNLIIYFSLCTRWIRIYSKKMDMNGYIAVQSLLFWRALTDNDRGSKFHIKSGSWLSADMFIDCKDVQVFMDGEVQKYMHQIIIVMKEMFQLMRSGFNILMKQSILLLQGCCNIYGRYYRKKFR